MRIPLIRTRLDELFYGKKRQGRSKETRLLLEQKKIQEYWINKKLYDDGFYENGNVCVNCGDNTLEFDPHNGYTSCTQCGEVVNDGPFIVDLPFSCNLISHYPGYSRTVYFMEKIAQLCGDGPWIYDEDFELIERAVEQIRVQAGLSYEIYEHYLYPDPEVRASTHPREKYRAVSEFFDMFGWTDPILRFGRSHFTRIAKSVGLGHKKYGERFMQIRLRLGLEDDLENGGMSKCFRNHLKYRMLAYERTRSELERELGQPLENIAVNYLIVQFIILEDRDAWNNRWVKYIHVTNDKSKLDDYNRVWAYMIKHIKERYTILTLTKSERTIVLNWKFKALTLFDLYHPNKLPR
jgi:hypothetical protein